MEKAIAAISEQLPANLVMETKERIVINIHQSLIDQCKAGSREAQYKIYKLYSRAMINVAWRIVGSQAEAEDVLQESFLSAFSHLPTYKGEGTFGAWLKKIVVNKATNLIRKRQVRVSTTDLEKVDMADEEPCAERDEEVLLSAERIKRAIPQLPDGFRVVLSLYLLEGYDHKEIAEILGITESTSKSQFNRAKNRLRELLKQEVNDG